MATNGSSRDPFIWAVSLAILVVGVIAVADIVTDGKLDPSVIALFGAVLTPTIAVAVARYGRNGQ